jgi:hypothetical protein
MAQRTFTVGVPEELFQALERAAESRGLKRNGFVREALEAALNGGAVPDGVRSAVRPTGESAAPPRAPSPRERVPESPLVRRASSYVKQIKPIPKGKP